MIAENPFPSAAGALRIARRLLAMACWLMVSLIGYHLSKLIRAPNPWPRRFLAGIGRIAGLRFRTKGQPAPGRLLILANHVSWIDIPALAEAAGTAFVAHDGLATVPLLKWLCEMNDTIFIARHDRASIAAQIDALRAALAERRALTIFPEGTTSDGTTLLPFKSSLLAALDPLPPGMAVQPVWLDYGLLAPDVAWVGEEAGISNFLRIIARPAPLDLTIHFLEPLSGPTLANRKTMTAAAHRAITQAMTPLQQCGNMP